jgi:uncharacterized protein YbjT (DUF2867 family)
MRILVAGGRGFVGQHLVRRLVADGHEVMAMTRRPRAREDGSVDVFGDVDDAASIKSATTDIDVAYYLVHTLDRPDFAERDRRGARNFAEQAAGNDVHRVTYLGGLGDERDDLSEHLRSRREVEHILSSELPTTALRAGIVVGDGSVSWEILCQLVERLPVMITPRWVQTSTQPIALSDVVEYLVRSITLDTTGQHFDIGAPAPMTYQQMLKAVAHLLGRSLHVVPVPVLSPRLSSQWLRLVTDVDLQTAQSLVDSMTNEVVVTERRLERLTGHRPMRFVDAARAALQQRAERKLRDAVRTSVA